MEKNVCKMTDDSIFLIDIEKILKTKAGKKYKYIPRFVVSYLKHIVHQDELNVFLKDSKNKVGVDFLEACMEFLDAKVEIKGLENLPENGKCTFVSNHPLGGQDGVALGYILGKHYNGNVRYLVNDLLMNLHGLAPLCIPINKTGSQSRDFPKMVEAGFASDNHIIMFPAGLCSRRQGGEIKDLEWKKTFVTKSIETHRDVVPLHFEGRNSDFFYNLANICKALGIKFNGTLRIVLGKSLTYILIYVVVCIWVLAVVPKLFSLPQVGDPVTILLFILPYLFASIFFAMTLSGFMTTREAPMLVFVFTSVILLFISGVSWPKEAIPPFWQAIGYLFPSTPGIQGFIRINTCGAALNEVVHEYHTLWIQAGVYFVLALVIYRFQIIRSRKMIIKQHRYMKMKQTF